MDLGENTDDLSKEEKLTILSEILEALQRNFPEKYHINIVESQSDQKEPVVEMSFPGVDELIIGHDVRIHAQDQIHLVAESVYLPAISGSSDAKLAFFEALFKRYGFVLNKSNDIIRAEIIKVNRNIGGDPDRVWVPLFSAIASIRREFSRHITDVKELSRLDLKVARKTKSTTKKNKSSEDDGA